MINLETGEILYSRQIGYAFNLSCPNDVGLNKVLDCIKSTIRGARLKREPLQLRVMFSEPIDSLDLPFESFNPKFEESVNVY